MNESLTVPVATTIRTVPVRVLEQQRKQLNALLSAAGRKVSFTHLIALALVEAWNEFPVMGHVFQQIDGKPYRVAHPNLNFGLAVDVQRPDGSRGLMVPVVHEANQLGIRGFLDQYDALVVKARDGKLALEEMLGATMTLTNPGGLGTTASVPRLMASQGTIIATGAIAYPAEYREHTAEQIATLGIAKVLTITSTYDHRVIQGAESGSFLRLVDQLLQGEHTFYERVTAALTGESAAAPVASATPAAVEAPAATTPAAPAEPFLIEPPATLQEIHDDLLEEPAPYEKIPNAPVTTTTEQLASVAAAMALVKAHRMHGHLAARLDPLGDEPSGDPAMDTQTVGLTDEIMQTIPASVLRIGVEGETFADALPRLREKYCGTIAYEIEHISDHEQRVWLRRMIEAGEHRRPLSKPAKLRLLERLTDVEVFERFVRRAYLTQKQFSIEGVDMLVPMLDEAVELAALNGSDRVLMGMAHRGRLNVLTHILGRPYETILREFEAEGRVIAGTETKGGGTGDVKYHQGATGSYQTQQGHVEVVLSSNPSHLEAVNPVITGRARASQTLKSVDADHVDTNSAFAIQIHGDAAFPGQGIVAETLNLQGLNGYSVGGSLHIIANNQMGFTTNPEQGRSTRYASDLAKGFDAPIIHVNADDPEACLAAVQLAVAFRHRFRRDAVIDLVGYRRHGHNETDEPAYTQPRRYAAIKEHSRVREIFAKSLIDQGFINEAQVQELYDTRYKAISERHDTVLKIGEREPSELDEPSGDTIELRISEEPATALDEATIRRLMQELAVVPDGFTVHPKLVKQLDRRLGMPDAKFDWGAAEALAHASLLEEGIAVRLTGQDAQRGTFAHRHMMLHDVNTGETYAPIQHLPGADAQLEVHNSPLSEAACLGFEYGYSIEASDALVIWEAQFGDFVNGAQIIIDQFINSGMVKWGDTTRLTLLLPHGYEGNGPEHSNARLARWLSAAAEGSIRIANCTTAAQFFHLMRRQGKLEQRRPLIVMTPKGLLRAPHAMSPIGDFTSGRFEWIIDDPLSTSADARAGVTRLVLCSGKVYYDIAGYGERAGKSDTAVVRTELLYPFPRKQMTDLLASYPNVREVVWAQEEPLNHGPYQYMLQRVKPLLADGVTWSYAGRPKRSSPSEGYTSVHLVEQERIVREALGLA